MTAKIIKRNVEVITQVNGLKRSELLARIPAATTRLSTVLKILAKVRKLNDARLVLLQNMLNLCIIRYVDAFHQCDKCLQMYFSVATQVAGFHIAAQGQICSDIGQMSMKSGFECKEAATAFGKVIKSVINAQPGWCIFHNNEVYWDIMKQGVWKLESQEICSNDGWFPGSQQGNIF